MATEPVLKTVELKDLEGSTPSASATLKVMTNLLHRNEFRESVFQRDNNCCVICQAPSQDAHHILERRLWSDGGYYLDNGASLCAEHHLQAEKTLITVEEIIEACNIKKRILPEHLYEEYVYDKWGNIILPSGRRIIGELFFDESVQKVLKSANVLDQFDHRVKYQRTFHLPFSPCQNSDDKTLKDTSNFDNKEVVVTIKMDGENTTMYQDYIHARSLDSRNHPSRDWVKNLHSKICMDIPYSWRICGENLYAKHSIEYCNLISFFHVFSIWNEKNICLSWDDTLEWCDMIGLVPVTQIYRGKYDQDSISEAFDDYKKDHPGEVEGYVIRLSNAFSYAEFRSSIAKWVRPNHVQTHGHWMRTTITKNNL